LFTLLNSDLTPTHFSPTFGSSSYTNKKYWYYRIGKMYYLNIEFTATDGLIVNSPIFALPIGVIPKSDQTGQTMMQYGVMQFVTGNTVTNTVTAVVKPTNDDRYWISSCATVEKNSAVKIFGHILVN
jgi:hypothetical protein